MSHRLKNNEYELFTHNRKTYSFYDSTFKSGLAIVNAPDEMWQWLRSTEGVRPMDDSNTAYFLTPATYLIWKLKYS